MALLFRCNNKLQLNLTRFLNVPACYSAKWDSNWDHRDPKSITEPPKSNNPEDLQKYNEALEKCKSKAVRNFYLIYDCQYRSGNKYPLTELGRKQADLTGKRLAAFGLKFDALIRDDDNPTPAPETANIIAKHLNKDLKVTEWVIDGFPILPEPPLTSQIKEYVPFQEGARMEAAFRRYFYRAPPGQTHDTNTLFVCGQNAVRFFVCSREPESITKPSKSDNPAEDNKYNEKLEKAKSKAVRHLFLIRHGQYNVNGDTDKERILTDLGRKQADLTGQRLASLDIKWDALVRSTMTRAQETACLIAKHLDKDIEVKNCQLIEEGAPIPPEPPVGHWKPEPRQFFQDGARIEAAFRRYFYRAPPEQTQDTYTLLVCHANVIRFFVCRALQFPPEGWLRISLNHGSITWISILPNGNVVLRALSDTGFMEPKVITSR